jgi:hypothetical protein
VGAAAAFLVGCGPSEAPVAPVTHGTTPTPSLIGTYRFEIPESSETSSITVVFSGQLNPGTGTASDTKFSASGVAQVARGPGTGTVSFSVPAGLKAGTWTVTATPNGFGAPVRCDSVTVPGTVTLSVVQGEPRCGR